MVGARIVDPLIIPIADDLNARTSDASLMLAAFTLSYACSQLILGPVADRHGALRVMFFAIAACALFTAACGFARGMPGLLAMRACAGAASAGLIPACMAYIGGSVPYNVRQVTLGRFLTGIVMAQVIAGPVGGVIGQVAGWRAVFMIIAAFAVLLLVILRLTMVRLPEPVRTAYSSRAQNYLRLAQSKTSRMLLLATLAEGAFLAGVFPFIAPFLSSRLGLSYAEAGVLVAGFGLGAFTYTRLARKLLIRLGEPGLVLTGGLLTALGLAALTLIDASRPAVLGIEAALGLGYFMMHGVLQVRATELLPDARSTAVGAFVFMLFTGQAAGTAIMSFMMVHAGFRAAFLTNASIVLCLAVWISQFLLTHHPPLNKEGRPAQAS